MLIAIRQNIEQVIYVLCKAHGTETLSKLIVHLGDETNRNYVNPVGLVWVDREKRVAEMALKKRARQKEQDRIAGCGVSRKERD